MAGWDEAQRNPGADGSSQRNPTTNPATQTNEQTPPTEKHALPAQCWK